MRAGLGMAAEVWKGARHEVGAEMAEAVEKEEKVAVWVQEELLNLNLYFLDFHLK